MIYSNRNQADLGATHRVQDLALMRDGEEHLGLQAGLQEEAMGRQRAAATAGEDRKTSARFASSVPDKVTLVSRWEGLLLALVASQSETTTPTCFLWLWNWRCNHSRSASQGIHPAPMSCISTRYIMVVSGSTQHPGKSSARLVDLRQNQIESGHFKYCFSFEYIFQWIRCFLNCVIILSINHSTNQSINQSIDQSMNQSIING